MPVTPAVPLPFQAASLSAVLREAVVDRGDVPAAVALVAGRSAVLYHEAFGSLDAARNTPLPGDAIFRLGSMTKPITSAAIAMLVEEGRLRLDDQACQYVPSMANPLVLERVNHAAGTFRTRPARRPITVRHLLTHTSGIGYPWSHPALALVHRITGCPDTELPLVHDPAERWTYGSGTRVLGEIIEQVSGRPLDAFLRERFFQPLGMTDTAFAVPHEHHARVVTYHQRIGGDLVEQRNPAQLDVTIRGDKGLYSTAADYARFLRMLLNGGTLDGTRLLAEQSVLELTRNQIGRLPLRRKPAADPGITRPFPRRAGTDTWGLGLQIATTSAPRARGAGSFSWSGIYNTHFWVDPANGLAAVLLMQLLPFYDARALALLRQFERGVYGPRTLRPSSHVP